MAVQQTITTTTKISKAQLLEMVTQYLKSVHIDIPNESYYIKAASSLTGVTTDTSFYNLNSSATCLEIIWSEDQNA